MTLSMRKANLARPLARRTAGNGHWLRTPRRTCRRRNTGCAGAVSSFAAGIWWASEAWPARRPAAGKPPCVISWRSTPEARQGRDGRHSRPRLPPPPTSGRKDHHDPHRRRLRRDPPPPRRVRANKPEKLTTITPANSPLHPLGSPTQSPPTQCPPQDRTCRSCGAIQNFIVDRRCWVCPRCGTSSSP